MMPVDLYMERTLRHGLTCRVRALVRRTGMPPLDVPADAPPAGSDEEERAELRRIARMRRASARDGKRDGR